MESNELRIGRAGQHLAMFDLLSNGYCCCQTEEGMNYDVIVDLGVRIVRLQVKTTQRPARMNQQYCTPTYLFHVRRAGRNGVREYQIGEFEAFALVCMDTRSVWYYPFVDTIKRTLIFRVPGIEYKQHFGRAMPYINEFTKERLFKAFTGPEVDQAYLTKMVTQEHKLSPEMEAVLSVMDNFGSQTIEEIVQKSQVPRTRVYQILTRRGKCENGQWTLRPLTATGRLTKTGQQAVRHDGVMFNELREARDAN